MTGLECATRAAAGRDGAQGAVRLQHAEHRDLRIEEGQHAFHGLIADGTHLQGLGQAASHAGQFGGHAARPLRLRVDPRIVKGQPGMVGEGLDQSDVLGAEGASGPVRDADGPYDLAVHEQRHGEDGAIAGLLDPAPLLRADRDGGIVEDVGRGHGLAPRHGKADRSRAAGPHQSVFKTGADVARHRHADELLSLLVESIQRRGVSLKQAFQGLHDSLLNFTGVKRLGEQPGSLGEALRELAPPLRLLQKMAIALLDQESLGGGGLERAAHLIDLVQGRHARLGRLTPEQLASRVGQ